MRKDKFGFTLIEVLIVISIIAALAAILIVAVMGTINPVKVRTTDRRIKIIEDGLKRFVDEFEVRKNVSTGTESRGYPKLEEFAGVSIDNNLIDNMHGGEFLRLILYPTDEELEELKDYGITKRVMTEDEVGEMLNELIEDDGEGRRITANTAFVDSWGVPFRYAFPGLNHSDKGLLAKSHKNWKDQYGLNHKSRMNPKPDIWSAGLNNEDNKDIWSNEPNDPFQELDEGDNDDITNWFVNER